MTAAASSSFPSMPSADILVSEASELIRRLDARLADCYEWSARFGEVPKAGMAREIRKLKQVRYRALRRLNRRKSAAGVPFSIAGAMWIINQADSGYF